MLISISSSDLDSGRRPIAISDEFSEISILISEIRRCENKAFPKKRPTYWDFESGVRSGFSETTDRAHAEGAGEEFDIEAATTALRVVLH